MQPYVNHVKEDTQTKIRERGIKEMCITCKAHVCQNLTISWSLGLTFSSAFVAFSVYIYNGKASPTGQEMDKTSALDSSNYHLRTARENN